VSTDSLRQLLDQALAEFDDSSTSVAAHLRRAIRIATRRQDYLGLIELLPETFDLTVGTKIDNPAFRAAESNLVSLLGKEQAKQQVNAAIRRQMRNRTVDKVNIRGGSIAQLEAQLKQVSELIESYQNVPANLTPFDTYFVLKDFEKASAAVIPLRSELEAIIERVRQAIYDFLVETERQMDVGQVRPHVFDRAREYLRTSLTSRAPDALRKLESAENALAEGGSENLSYALTSCRRTIKELADALYPATNAIITGLDGRKRKMNDEAYRNRLMQYATERVGKSHERMLDETLRSLGNRLERLIDLASKGVHGDVTQWEAETCLTWTYLTIADLLRLADGSADPDNLSQVDTLKSDGSARSEARTRAVASEASA
jgi:hypothetical protein